MVDAQSDKTPGEPITPITSPKGGAEEQVDGEKAIDVTIDATAAGSVTVEGDGSGAHQKRSRAEEECEVEPRSKKVDTKPGTVQEAAVEQS